MRTHFRTSLAVALAALSGAALAQQPAASPLKNNLSMCIGCHGIPGYKTAYPEVYHVPNGHTANLLMSYIPQEKLLIITDIFNDFGEPRPNDPPPGLVSPYYAALGERVRELKLDVQRIAPSHGRGVVPADMLWKALQGKVQAPLASR